MNFVAEQNVARFRKLLLSEADPDKRATIGRLLIEEEAKIRGDQKPGSDPGPS